MGQASRPKGPEGRVRFDITDPANRLRADGILKYWPKVTIRPGGDPAADAKSATGEYWIVQQ
jgi:hypothetical protein